jgi:Domain of unknown function DUF29
LPGNRPSILQTRGSDFTVRDPQPSRDLSNEVLGTQIYLFDPQEQVIARAGRLVGWDFLDLEVGGLLLDPAADAREGRGKEWESSHALAPRSSKPTSGANKQSGILNKSKAPLQPVLEFASMTPNRLHALQDLYEQDETAWLDQMADLIRQGRYEELDYTNLGEYLSDMAVRDRREVKSLLTTFLADWLRWEKQPERRSGEWAANIVAQRQELADLVFSGVLRSHAEAVLDDAYDNAARQVAIETGDSIDSFPRERPCSIDELIRVDQLPEWK